MTLQELKNKYSETGRIRLSDEPYLFINLFLGAVIALIFIYSAVFSPVKNDYPVACIHEKITGQACVSCGLSHSFSLIMRGDLNEACIWNIYGMRIFIFFVCQFIMRAVFSFLYLRYPSGRKDLMITDSTGSALMFLVAFWPFMQWIIAVLSSVR